MSSSSHQKEVSTKWKLLEIFHVNLRNNPMPILVSPLICTKMSPGIGAWLLIVVGGRDVVGIDCDRIVDEMGSGHINRGTCSHWVGYGQHWIWPLALPSN